MGFEAPGAVDVQDVATSHTGHIGRWTPGVGGEER
jgi:hypothetical protein